MMGFELATGVRLVTGVKLTEMLLYAATKQHHLLGMLSISYLCTLPRKSTFKSTKLYDLNYLFLINLRYIK